MTTQPENNWPYDGTTPSDQTQPPANEPTAEAADEPAAAAPSYGAPYYGPPQYAPPQYGPGQYGQPQYGAPQYGQSQYGQPQYGPGQFASSQYGAPSQYGPPQYGNYGYPQQQFGGPSYYAPPPGYRPPVTRPARRWTIATIATCAVLAAATVTGVALTARSTSVNGQASGSSPYGNYPFSGGSGSGGTGSGSTGSGSTGSGSTGSGGTGSGSGGTGSGSGGFGSPGGSGSGSGSGSTSAAQASSAQSVGVVDINTVLKYQEASAAGTGLILTSSGEILTNNHVVNGATSITVTVVSTGKTYKATVVGTDPTDDVAVIKLSGASGLKTAALGDSDTVKVGDSVTGVGNAGGVGGTPSAVTGTVTALNKTITASDQDGSASEKLTGVIVSSAPIEPGDSGGPLYNSSGKIIGIDTAASESGASEAFTIPIDHALTIAGQIESGVRTSAIHIGYPGFMAVSVSTDTTVGGAGIAGVVSGGPAAEAGIVAGDVITKVGSHKVTTPDSLKTAITAYRPGDRVSVTYLDQSGKSHTVTVTLTTGPAD